MLNHDQSILMWQGVTEKCLKGLSNDIEKIGEIYKNVFYS